MIERDPKTLARLQAVVTALIEHRVSTSLVDVERALARWRSGAHSALAAQADGASISPRRSISSRLDPQPSAHSGHTFEVLS